MTTASTAVADRISAIHLEEQGLQRDYEKMFGLLDSYVCSTSRVWSGL
jgi:hypothetical protein